MTVAVAVAVVAVVAVGKKMTEIGWILRELWMIERGSGSGWVAVPVTVT
jgi:hypothetical protein